MAEFQFVSILLHTLPDLQGWQIIGIRHDYDRELITSLTQVTGQEAAERLAHQLADRLAINPEPDFD